MRGCQNNLAFLSALMSDILEGPTLTYHYSTREDFSLPEGAAYVYAESVERRSHLPEAWARRQEVEFVEIVEEDYQNFAFAARNERYQLRSEAQLEAFLGQVSGLGTALYIDITGLSHHVWVPLVSRMLVKLIGGEVVPPFYVVYVEPRHYTKSAVPRPGDIFALSEKSHGIRPLPGMLKLRRQFVSANLLVVLLGFEGWRFEAILAAFEPDAGSVVPVIGVPGYRAEYPFYTVEGNFLPLNKDDNWTRRQLARANDPFEVFEILHRLTDDTSGVRVAMVGTKPHSLGAVLFAATYPSLGELVYDNPIRSAGRTDEGSCLQVYDISEFAGVLGTLGLLRNGEEVA